MSEELLVTHCSPTLADIKTANLFNCPCENLTSLKKQITVWNKILNPKGIRMVLLKFVKGKALIYVYRPNRLEKDLDHAEVRRLLLENGYQNVKNIEDCIQYLSKRLDEYEEFPHEIGLFLGYPVRDVESFIENKGKKYKCIGFWKVYHDENGAVKKFQEFKHCTKCYKEKIQEGQPIETLIVG